MKKKLAALIAVVFAVVAVSTVVFAVDNGPETIVIDNIQKKKPAVTFPHRKHQEMLKDCKICHHKAKEGEQPKSCAECHGKVKEAPKFKKAMHKKCRDCHKKEKAAGKNPPTKCNQCHKK